MTTKQRGESNRSIMGSRPSELAFAFERDESDVALEAERTIVDDELAGLDRVRGGLSDDARRRTARLASIRKRIRAKRGQIDEKRGADRSRTDVALRAREDSHNGELKRVNREATLARTAATVEHRALRVAEDNLTSERRDHESAFRLILTQLDVIASASNALALDGLGSESETRVLGFASEIVFATDRIMDLCSDLLDPSDHRGRYHDLGGSG